MIWLLVAGAVAAAVPADAPPLGEAAHALSSGRLDQARLMIANAVKAGVHGPALDRLLADLAFETADYAGAIPRYEALLDAVPRDPLIAERIGIAAIHQGDLSRATRAINLATRSPAASWRAWNARGVIADQRGDWAEADRAYAHAARVAPARPEILNNQGWSLLLRGRWTDAQELFEQAAVLDPRTSRIANNRELAEAAVSENLPRRLAGESDSNWAARLNDAGIVAGIRGDHQRAIAAFAQAIVARTIWFRRAANNLSLAERGK